MILLYCYMTVVAVAHLLVGVMEYQGLKQQVSGANGFIWTMVTLFMGTMLFVTSAVAWLFWDGRTALQTLALGALWLGASAFVSLKIMMAGAAK